MHFCWKDRTSGQVEDDLIIFPDDVEFRKVAQCTTGRVFVLKFKSNNRRCFYWMQEPKTEKDDDFCTKVNEYLNNPPQPGANLGSGRGASDLAGLGGEEDLQNLIHNMTQSQLQQLFNGFRESSNFSGLLGRGGSALSSGSQEASRDRDSSAMETETTAVASSTPAARATDGSSATTPSSGEAKRPGFQLSDLSNILSNIKVPEGASGGSSSSGAPKVDLSGALSSSDALEPLLGNPDFMERLKEFLPPSESADSDLPEQVKTTIKSPQFQQAASMFSAALGSGQLGPLMQQFGMSADVVAAAATGDMGAFVKALEASQKKPERDTPME